MAPMTMRIGASRPAAGLAFPPRPAHAHQRAARGAAPNCSTSDARMPRRGLACAAQQSPDVDASTVSPLSEPVASEPDVVEALGIDDAEVEDEQLADFALPGFVPSDDEWDDEDDLREYEREPVFLVGVEFVPTAADFEDASPAAQAARELVASGESLLELERLARAAGLRVVGTARQRLERAKTATLIGKGKAFEIRREARALGATTVFFDHDLSPSQAKNLEDIMGGGSEDEHDDADVKIRVADRTALILDIFSQRAATREGKLQVEMAQAQYQLPRLTRLWTHLERQTAGGGGGGGGGAARGMGEKQIEVDKRLLRRRIAAIKRELEQVRMQRAGVRAKRARAGVPVVALCGYTNAGKSSLLNRLAEGGRGQVMARDMLFATLSPTTRRVRLPSGKRILLSDTVGFVSSLPSELVEAFQATLEELGGADLLIHVVDVSSPMAYAQVASVEDTLGNIEGVGSRMESGDLHVLHAWNKLDMAHDPEAILSAASGRWPATVACSTKTGEGLGDLLLAIETTLAESMVDIDVVLPYDRGELVALAMDEGVVDHVEYVEHGTRVVARVPSAHVDRFAPYAAQPQEDEV